MTGSELDKVDGYIENAYERIKAAKSLIENGHYTDSVNRSYYAMANMAMAALALQDVKTKTHKGLHLKFHELYVKSELIDIAYGRNMNKVEMIRGKCDYNMSFQATEEVAKDTYLKASGFIEEVQRVIDEIIS